MLRRFFPKRSPHLPPIPHVRVKVCSGAPYNISMEVAMAIPRLRREVETSGQNVPILVQVNISHGSLKGAVNYVEELLKLDNENDIKSYRENFVEKLSLDELVAHNGAAIELEITSLGDLCSKTLATRMGSMTPKEIRKKLGIEDDLTTEEKTDIRATNYWAFHEFGPGTSHSDYE